MIDAAPVSVSIHEVEAVLCADLHDGNQTLATVTPILRHLLTNSANSLFADDVIAGVRGMSGHVALQLFDELRKIAGDSEQDAHPAAEIDALTAEIAANPAFIGHVHALALEWQVTQRLQSRLSVDPVVSPLLQAQIASSDPATAQLGMALLAAQARFCQTQRRMELPLGELPADLLHAALLAMRTLAGSEVEADTRAVAAEAAIRARFDESRSRLALIARMVAGLGGTAQSALSVTHAGAAIFATALALASGQDRDLAVLSFNESQLARLALSLRSAGLKPQAVAEQFLALHPDIMLPQGFEQVGPDHAAALLVSGSNLAGA